MSEMVERVARAICEAERMNPDDALGGWIHWQDAARAAIEAMREPTEFMLDGASSYRGEPNYSTCRYVWGSMITAALFPSREEEGKSPVPPQIPIRR